MFPQRKRRLESWMAFSRGRRITSIWIYFWNKSSPHCHMNFLFMYIFKRTDMLLKYLELRSLEKSFYHVYQYQDRHRRSFCPVVFKLFLVTELFLWRKSCFLQQISVYTEKSRGGRLGGHSLGAAASPCVVGGDWEQAGKGAGPGRFLLLFLLWDHGVQLASSYPSR